MTSAGSQKQAIWAQFSIDVPEMPSAIRYYDDFLDEMCSIRNPAEMDAWLISRNGTNELLDFKGFPTEIRLLIKHWCCDQIQNLAISTGRSRFHDLRRIEPSDLSLIISTSPASARSNWQLIMSKNYGAHEAGAIKSIFYYFCKFNMGGWSSQYTEFLSSLPLPAFDKYSNVRSGNVFLSVDEEALLVSHFDSNT